MDVRPAARVAGRQRMMGDAAARIRRQADAAERHAAGLRGGAHRRRRAADGTDDHDPLVADAVVEAQAGSRDAIRFLYARYAGEVHDYALSMLHNEDDAEDVTQRVFVKLLGNLHRYEAREVPFAAWVMRMTRNLAIDSLRARREVPVADCARTGSVDVSVPMRGADLHAALVRLPADQREVVVLRHLRGLSAREIGERLDRSEASIRGLHQRGSRALRQELAKLGAAPSHVHFVAVRTGSRDD